VEILRQEIRISPAFKAELGIMRALSIRKKGEKDVLYCDSRRLRRCSSVPVSSVLTTLLPLKSAIKPSLLTQVMTNIEENYAAYGLYKTSKYVSEEDLDQFCLCNISQVPVNSQLMLKEVLKTHIQGAEYLYSM
jgi:hypothetical protein